jgi:hypothetical protein
LSEKHLNRKNTDMPSDGGSEKNDEPVRNSEEVICIEEKCPVNFSGSSV